MSKTPDDVNTAIKKLAASDQGNEFPTELLTTFRSDDIICAYHDMQLA